MSNGVLTGKVCVNFLIWVAAKREPVLSPSFDLLLFNPALRFGLLRLWGVPFAQGMAVPTDVMTSKEPGRKWTACFGFLGDRKLFSCSSPIFDPQVSQQERPKSQRASRRT